MLLMESAPSPTINGSGPSRPTLTTTGDISFQTAAEDDTMRKRQPNLVFVFPDEMRQQAIGFELERVAVLIEGAHDYLLRAVDILPRSWKR